VIEDKAGRLAEARAWYEKSRELAMQLRDQAGIGQSIQNIGIVYQAEGEAARERCDEPVARRHFEEARRLAEESLEIWKALGNRPFEAMSSVHLARSDLLLGNLDSAEENALSGLVIDEELQAVLELPSDYDTLSKIAQARGNAAAAAEWAKKRDDLRAELERRAGGGDGLPAEMLKALQALTLACAQAGFGDGDFNPDAEEVLAHLEGGPAPFPEFAGFLRQLAAGHLAAIPSNLPAELREWLESQFKEVS
jgi:tetratricopeptide (TPR) repeat protein